MVENILSSRKTVLNLWDQMPDNLRRWSWYNNRNKVHNKRNVLESSQNDHLPPICGKIVFHETSSWCQKGWGLPLRISSWSVVLNWLNQWQSFSVFFKHQVSQLVTASAHATLACQYNSMWLKWKQQLKLIQSKAELLKLLIKDSVGIKCHPGLKLRKTAL